MSTSTKFTVNWDKKKKLDSQSDFLTNKHIPLKLPAPDKIETTKINNTMLIKPSKPLSSKMVVAIKQVKNKISTFASVPVKYCYNNISRTKNILITPYTLIGYTHVLLNLFITASFIYIVGFFIYFLKIDVLYKINEKREIMKGVVNNVRQKYIINKCDPSTRVPALQEQCAEWENIIKNGFSALNYTKIIIELVATSIDEFVSKITYKTLFTLAFLMLFYLRYRK